MSRVLSYSAQSWANEPDDRNAVEQQMCSVLAAFEAADQEAERSGAGPDGGQGGGGAQSKMAQLLRFATGTVAITNSTMIHVLRGDDSSRFPTAATCTSEVTLPNYGSAEELQRRLETAMASANAMMQDCAD